MKLSTKKAQKTKERPVTVEHPPQIRALNISGERYVRADDVSNWLLYLSENLVDAAEPDPEVKAAQALLADQIHLLATFTTERLAV